MTSDLPAWMAGLTRTDFLYNGHKPADEATWADLDWSRAYVDMGPSPMGNLGPYWHVPRKSADTVHRLYPTLLKTKWLLLVRQAIEEFAAQKKREAA